MRTLRLLAQATSRYRISSFCEFIHSILLQEVEKGLAGLEKERDSLAANNPAKAKIAKRVDDLKLVLKQQKVFVRT